VIVDFDLLCFLLNFRLKRFNLSLFLGILGNFAFG